jgi:hypothetical protein
MATICLSTNGKSIGVNNSKLGSGKNSMTGNGYELAYMSFQVGGDVVLITFGSWEELSSFCIAHNFDFFDERVA